MKNKITWARIQRYNLSSSHDDNLGAIFVERGTTVRTYLIGRNRINRATSLFKAYMERLINKYNHDQDQFVCGISVGE